MSKEKECKCCHEWWYDSEIKNDLCPNCYDYFKQLKQKLKEKDKEIEMLNIIKNNAIECAYLFKVILSVRQKQLAIQELEKVKSKCDGMYDLWLNSKYKENMYDNEDIAGVFEDISVFTNDLIKELKGEKDDRT